MAALTKSWQTPRQEELTIFVGIWNKNGWWMGVGIEHRAANWVVNTLRHFGNQGPISVWIQSAFAVWISFVSVLRLAATSMVNWIEGFGWFGTRFGFRTQQICMIQKYTHQTTCYRYDQKLRVFCMCKSMCKSTVAACSVSDRCCLANVLDAASRASALQESLRKKEIEVRSYNCEREKMLEWMKMVSRFGKIHTARF